MTKLMKGKAKAAQICVPWALCFSSSIILIISYKYIIVLKENIFQINIKIFNHPLEHHLEMTSAYYKPSKQI